MLSKIYSIHAEELPEHVLEYCGEMEISTHYQNDVASIKNDGNPFADWLKTQGCEFKEFGTTGDYYCDIAIWAT